MKKSAVKKSAVRTVRKKPDGVREVGPALPSSAMFKKIERHTEEELEAAIQAALDRFGKDYWLMLHGIDAYMERRKRRKIERADNLMKSILAANFKTEQPDWDGGDE